ncbi:hypothetical protein DYBT9623_00815 [Dyadobacter sp. CECT 9623]|uniref:Alpha-L-fucosidase 2 n=1 Tax=Dyadobacter linearis TaxID=2823330 RepID=A0ABM8UL32_9BACT|nr:glycoside hydrolase family 95 protein [Dyadobacter sp. CECT 9623]CAG5068087.1 hypothetical protein DYBT9623_00815 [Dyadobacter sp. CECT 9623]
MICKNILPSTLAVLLFIVCLTPQNAWSQNPLRLWYDKPARQWEETIPLGNGRLGMMSDGGVQRENIVLNDITLWSGGVQDANNYEAHKSLPEIRRLLLEGKNDEAQQLVNKNFVAKGAGSGHGDGADVPFGCYQVLGNLRMQFEYKNVDSSNIQFQNYRRELSLNDAVASVVYTVNGVTYRREYFTSFGDDIGVIKLSADKPGNLNLRLSLDRPERFQTIIKGNNLEMSGQLNNGTDGKGMRYLAKVRPEVKGGKVAVSGKELVITNSNEVILYFSAGTDFKVKNFEFETQRLIDVAVKKSYSVQKQVHLLNYQKLFNRANFRLGKAKIDDIPTDQRLFAYQKEPASDLALPVLFFQFGRYLSISSTRVGLLPPNLQGLWANQIRTPWNGDYHLDVNVQMNHWPVEVTNLSELNLPLADLVKGMVKPGEKTAKAYYNANGWVAHVITNVWGFTEPGEEASWGASNAGSGWICNNLWEHYAFTNDKNYLKEIYPILKGSAEFYSSALVKDPKTGWLVTAPSISPENTFYLANGKKAAICMGPTIDNQITRELFTNVITACEVLGLDADFKISLQNKLKELPPPGVVASDGRLMEWLEEYKETDPKHRHISHLYGLYPAPLITPEKTPELAAASAKTLEVRGDDSPGWSKAYKLLFWARLHDGNRADKLLKELLMPTLQTNMNYGGGGGVYPNLLSAGPPFQVDGNFGGTAGIAEMLIQSHDGYINILPAIPDTWKASGEVRGFKARGNFAVDFEWKDGKVTDYRISSETPRKVVVKVNGEKKEITSAALPH